MYLGIDRQYFQPEPELVLRWSHIPDDSVWSRLWHAYWEAEERGTIRSDRDLARDFERRFQDCGLALDLIYAEVTTISVPDEAVPSTEEPRIGERSALAYWRDVHEALGPSPPIGPFLGYDVSRPKPSFHSVLNQPGLESAMIRLGSALNVNGLFDDENLAHECLAAADSMGDESLPFAIIGVWSAEGSRHLDRLSRDNS